LNYAQLTEQKKQRKQRSRAGDMIENALVILCEPLWSKKTRRTHAATGGKMLMFRPQKKRKSRKDDYDFRVFCVFRGQNFACQKEMLACCPRITRICTNDMLGTSVYLPTFPPLSPVQQERRLRRLKRPIEKTPSTANDDGSGTAEKLIAPGVPKLSSK